MASSPGKEREQFLDPVARISEILFGLIMAVTIVGSLEIATAGRNEVRTVMIAALGCNVAWGLVDAFMYLVQTVTERTRNRVLAKAIGGADRDTAHRLIVRTLPEHVAAIAGQDEIEGMRRRLLALKLDGRPLLGTRDYLGALLVFVLVVTATFPVVAPFMLASEIAAAMRWSQAMTLGLLFFAGFGLGRYAGHAKPLRTGVLMTVLGAVLIVGVKALGG
jgi:VIT1/CCC1 family predicted Fe2+/Mn2+ transporter